jgi:hypothetical protein
LKSSGLEPWRERQYNHVATGVAVLAAIAAGDALWCHVLGERSRGQDHRQAIELLEQVRYGTAPLSVQAGQGWELAQALDVKDESRYCTRMLPREQVVRVMRVAEKLVVAARVVVRGEQ